MTSTSKRYCSVPQCNTYVDKDISMHYFPIKDVKLCKKWCEVLKIGKPVSKHMNVCSKHFLASDFRPSAKGDNLKVRRLKPTAIPSQNLPVRKYDKPGKTRQTKNSALKLPSERTEPMEEVPEPNLKEMDKADVEEMLEANVVDASSSQQSEKNVNFNSSHLSVMGEATIHECGCTEGPAKLFIDQGTQTDDLNFYNLQSVLNTDEKLKAFTGVDFKVLDTLSECTKEVATYNNKTVTDSTLKILLVLIKIKLNIPFTCLAILFGLSVSSASRYFYSTLSLLSLSVKPIVYWPTKEEVLANMPKCFKKYRDTRIVLDCTEIQVDKCKCLKCRILTYSHYKGRHTIKYLVGITPAGTISFVSSGYGGRTSDKAICNKEKIFDKMDMLDGIMVDKGVLIERECEERLLKLIRPPFLRKKKQFSKSDAEETANIARARVHVERAIERIKTFSILHGQISWYMVPYTNEIMTVVAALVNLSPPILADDKFEPIDECRISRS